MTDISMIEGIQNESVRNYNHSHDESRYMTEIAKRYARSAIPVQGDQC